MEKTWSMGLKGSGKYRVLNGRASPASRDGLRWASGLGLEGPDGESHMGPLKLALRPSKLLGSFGCSDFGNL